LKRVEFEKTTMALSVDVVDAVQLALEKEGILQTIRAQLRYSVLKVLSKNSHEDVASHKSTIELFVDSYGEIRKKTPKKANPSNSSLCTRTLPTQT
jgi:hypothetical protein